MEHAKRIAFSMVAASMLMACGDRPSDEEGPTGGEGNEVAITDSDSDGDACEIIEHQLADANEATPSGVTGADLLALVPAGAETTLDWFLSKDEIEIEIPNRSGNSTGLSVQFDTTAPRFFWVEAIDLNPADEILCSGSVGMEFRFSMTTTDGTVSAIDESLVLAVADGGGFADTIRASSDLITETPALSFVSPMATVVGRNARFEFDQGQLVGGRLRVTAEGADTYELTFATW